MRIIAKKPLLNFTHNIPKLNFLSKIGIEKLLLPNGLVLQILKKDFNSVDAVGNGRFVFNIKGNHFRIVVHILFVPKIIYIRFIGTHKEYDRIEKYR